MDIHLDFYRINPDRYPPAFYDLDPDLVISGKPDPSRIYTPKIN